MKIKRKIIKIDETLCNGCGLCVKGCHEGALQMIDGKARMVSELYCDGLGACIGDCPVGAIQIEERDAQPYSETAVIERIAPKGEATVVAHLNHLKDHNEQAYLDEGVDWLQKNGFSIDLTSFEQPERPPVFRLACGCPGSMERSFGGEPKESAIESTVEVVSRLTHWPIQLHLQNPLAGYFRGADLLLAADCTAYAYGDFQRRFLHNRVVSIACPKLDANKAAYVDKIVAMIDEAAVRSITVVVMEVPCCGGLMQFVEAAQARAKRTLPVHKIMIGVRGELK